MTSSCFWSLRTDTMTWWCSPTFSYRYQDGITALCDIRTNTMTSWCSACYSYAHHGCNTLCLAFVQTPFPSGMWQHCNPECFMLRTHRHCHKIKSWMIYQGASIESIKRSCTLIKPFIVIKKANIASNTKVNDFCIEKQNSPDFELRHKTHRY